MSILCLDATYESAREIGPWLERRLDDLESMLCSRRGELELAVHEVAINIVDHAFGADAAGRTYSITLDEAGSTQAVTVQFRDDGAAFETATAPNLDEPQVRGYGLFIAEQLTSSLSYERVDETNIWTLTFTHPDPPTESPTGTPAGGQTMSISTSSHEIRIATIEVNGRLDAVRAVDLRAEIAGAVADGIVRLVVDLGEAEFVDSAGLAALAKGMKDCRSQGGDLRLVSPQHEDALRVFALTRFDQVFTMGESIQSVLDSW